MSSSYPTRPDNAQSRRCVPRKHGPFHSNRDPIPMWHAPIEVQFAGGRPVNFYVLFLNSRRVTLTHHITVHSSTVTVIVQLTNRYLNRSSHTAVGRSNTYKERVARQLPLSP